MFSSKETKQMAHNLKKKIEKDFFASFAISSIVSYQKLQIVVTKCTQEDDTQSRTALVISKSKPEITANKIPAGQRKIFWAKKGLVLFSFLDVSSFHFITPASSLVTTHFWTNKTKSANQTAITRAISAHRASSECVRVCAREKGIQNYCISYSYHQQLCLSQPNTMTKHYLFVFHSASKRL